MRYVCHHCGRWAESPQPRARWCPECRPKVRGNRSSGKAQHYKGPYPRNAKAVRDRANADPDTRCWRCGLTLAQHAPHKTGRPVTWTAGHVIAGDPNSLLLAEASTCNYTDGAERLNTKAKPATLPTSRDWYHTQ